MIVCELFYGVHPGELFGDIRIPLLWIQHVAGIVQLDCLVSNLEL